MWGVRAGKEKTGVGSGGEKIYSICLYLPKNKTKNNRTLQKDKQQINNHGYPVGWGMRTEQMGKDTSLHCVMFYNCQFLES